MRYFLFFLFSLSFFMAMSQSSSNYISKIEAYRTEYKNSFLQEDVSPLDSSDLKDLRFFKADENYRVDCTFELTPEAKVFDMTTYSGKLKPYRKYGIIRFELNGSHQTLALYQSQTHLNHPVYKYYLFLPFKDETNGELSYGGGRYIDIKVSEIIDNRITIDFNKTYNPWCAYSSGYNCPIPPEENHLDIPLPAGEMEFAGTYKK